MEHYLLSFPEVLEIYEIMSLIVLLYYLNHSFKAEMIYFRYCSQALSNVALRFQRTKNYYDFITKTKSQCDP